MYDHMNRLIAFILALLLLSACGDSAPDPAPESLITISSGDVVGFAHEHATYAWKGIPFAAPPVNELRWRAPRAAIPWSDTLEATQFGSACVQPPNRTAGSNAPESEHSVGLEDCLTLNVFTPRTALHDAKQLPVMFWIHGGANILGSAQQYDGARLASEQNVVVVTINYRLGLFGWFRHESLRTAGDSASDHSGNYGTLDIIAALQWVQDNIKAFAGNPDKVTVFGESAGGRNTWSMVQTPLAKGLFHGAIVQSGTLKIMDPDKAESISADAPDYPSYQNNSAELVPKLVAGATGLDSAVIASALRALTADEIYQQLTAGSDDSYDQPRLFLDGHVFLEPALELFKDPAKYNSVPIITGTNRDEDKLFMMFNERWVDFRFGFFPRVKSSERYNKSASYGADTWRVFSVDRPAEVITRHGGASVYTYRFDFDDMSDAVLDMPLLMGAAHAMEIPFVFGNHSEAPWSWLFSNSEQRTELSAAMMNYWGAFAHTGDPGTGSAAEQPRWQPWQASGDHIMLLDTENDGGVRMSNQPMRVEDIKQRLFADAAFTVEERCEAYSALFLNGYMVADAFDDAERRLLCEGGAP
ncbi:carboxylesterase [Halieaceae bacterium IMCC14734]|uniref:Carboxylesterase n=1 Tax=Candidatus Litorirhabdus singularis TaxID=2518993 RepID=A0ABT3TEF3_9GAMM|nr:carboxylesterase family protein [Candidatus Litorirhabdus singularis]MCX2980658.1 carboxylesterase [Candidatus Litorirhabdus singularis]